MAEAKTIDVLEKLDRLRTELADLAFDLEMRGRLDAADIANAVSGRVGEICSELMAQSVAPRMHFSNGFFRNGGLAR